MVGQGGPDHVRSLGEWITGPVAVGHDSSRSNPPRLEIEVGSVEALPRGLSASAPCKHGRSTEMS